MKHIITQINTKSIITIILFTLSLIISSSYKITLTVTIDGTENFIFLKLNPRPKMTSILSYKAENQKIVFEWDSEPYYNCSHMFANLPALIEIDLSEFNSKYISDMNCMFCNCTNLTYVNFGKFNASLVESMENMFYNCEKLTSINFDEFYDVSSLINMYNMFGNCLKLKTLNLSSFYNNNYINGAYLFSNCIELTYINFSEYNIIHFNSMEYMFNNCKNLLYLNLSNFDATSVNDMNHMFYYCCQRITFLDLSNIYSLYDINMEFMFYSSGFKYINFTKTHKLYLNNLNYAFSLSSLISLDISSFETSKITMMYYMFHSSSNLKSIENINFNISLVESMLNMFSGLSDLTSLDLSSLSSSKYPIDMRYIFSRCFNLKIIEFPQKKVIKVKSMEGMFHQCDDLTTLDLSKFDTSQLKDMKYSFSYCWRLIYVNFTNFDTSSVIDMSYMFEHCHSLVSLDLSNFNTSSVIYMSDMFYGCYSLISLDLSNFDTTSLTSIGYMFQECYNLTYLNIFNFHNYKGYNIGNNVFLRANNFTYCLKDDNFYSFDLRFRTRDCSDKCYPEKRIYNKTSNKCIKCPKKTKASNNNTCEELNCSKYYNYEQTDCIEEIELGYYLNDTYEKTIDKCNEICKSCNKESTNMNLCINCSDNYYPILNDDLNINSYIKCYQNPEGYYLDINNLYYKPCYNSCEICDKEGNYSIHNCLICKENFIYELWYNDNYTYNYSNKNCYKECDYYFYFNENKKQLFCTETQKCPLNYSKLIEETNECISDCKNNSLYQYEFNNKCYSECPINTKASKNNIYYCELDCPKEIPFELIEDKECVSNCSIDLLLNKKCKLNFFNNENSIDIFFDNIQNYLTNTNYNLTNIKNGEDILLELNNTRFIITKENKNISKIEECEYLLRYDYNILNKDYIYKIIVINSNIEENNIKYEMYFPLEGNNLIKLNSTICNYKCNEEKCLKCTEKSINMNLCISCNYDYYPIINDSSNKYPYINCYQNPDSYYLDENDLIYKSCYNSCEICNISGNDFNHNCIKCKSEYIFETVYPSYINCYINCSNYYYYDNTTNKFYCTKELSCPKDVYNKLIPEKNKCIDKCNKDDIYKYEYKKQCYKECPLNTEEKDYYCNIKCPKEYPFEKVETQ